MDVFYFPYHTVSTKNPENGSSMQFGNSYKFTSKPNAPDMRIFSLKFVSMKLFITEGIRNVVTGDWSTPPSVDITTKPTRNAGALFKFYRDHKLHSTFIYPHPVYGSIKVKFNKPMEEPEALKGGTGEVPDIEVELMEQPL